MKLAPMVSEACIDLGIELGGKDEVLRRVAELAVRHPALRAHSADAVYLAMKERESIGSTGFGNGFALPHCRLDDVRQFVVGLLTVPQGVDFASNDGQPVRVVVFMVTPATQSNMHIRLLSEISRIFRQPGAVDSLVQAATAAQAKARLVAGGAEELEEKSNARSLLHVIVQDEGVFQGVLEAVAGVDPSSVVVVDGRTAEEHLVHVPLFAGLWSERDRPFCRIIMAWAERRLINETVRRIEHVAGVLDERTGILVSVHEPFYVGGRLTD